MEIYIQNGSERVLTKKAFLVSQTDEKGIITFANNDFCKVAGYDVDDLIGKPHNLVRHEDMPKIAFKELWDTVKKGDTWTGFVKNKCKNGNFYWIYATVFPIKVGDSINYVSCRRMPSADEVAHFSQLYKTLV